MNPSDQSPVDNQPNQNINPSPEVGTPNPVVPQPVSGDPLATPPKKSKKGLIIGLIAGGVVLIAGIVTLVLMLVLGGISKQDYSDAQTKAKTLASSYLTVSSVYVSSYDTESESAKKLETLKTGLSDIDKNFKELGDLKAIKNDKKAADYYKKVSTEKAHLETFVSAEIECLDKILPIVSEISAVSYSDADQTIATLKQYQAKLQALELKQKVNKDYLAEINAALPEFISALEAYVDSVNSGNYDSSLYSKVSSTSTKLTDADDTWRDNLEKLYDAIEFNSAVNDLGQYLTDKTNGN